MPVTPVEAVAARVKEVRKARGLNAAQLGERMTAQGVPWDRFTVANLEKGKRQNVTVVELLALATVLKVAPVHLLVPPLPSPEWGAGGNEPSDTAAYQVTPSRTEPMYLVRRFIRGETPLPGMDERAFYSEIPPQEFSPLLAGGGHGGEPEEAPER